MDLFAEWTGVFSFSFAKILLGYGQAQGKALDFEEADAGRSEEGSWDLRVTCFEDLGDTASFFQLVLTVALCLASSLIQ